MIALLNDPQVRAVLADAFRLGLVLAFGLAVTGAALDCGRTIWRGRSR